MSESRSAFERETSRVYDGGYLTLIGQRVRSRRSALKMSRKNLSQRSGVSERFIAHLEAGEGNISILRLRAIAASLGLPMAVLTAEPVNMDDRTANNDDHRLHPGSIAELFRRADPIQQRTVVDFLVGAARRHWAA